MEPAKPLSLVDCGLFDSIVRRAARPRAVRAVGLAAFMWLPLLALSLLVPRMGPEPTITFFEDLSTHVRFLFVAPLLILVEGMIGERTRTVIASFVTSGLVRAEDRGRFGEIVSRANRLVGSVAVEVILLVGVVVLVTFGLRKLAADDIAFWFERGSPEGGLSLAGYWYAGVSPLLTFLFVRWAWRYAVWCWLLRRVSRLDLHLAGTHPDRTGGLGFVRIGHNTFMLVSFAASSVVAAAAGTEILEAGAKLASFQNALIAFVVLSIAIGLVPLPVFMGALARTKRTALLEYGALGLSYVQSFERKWLRDTPPAGESLLGSGDIQSLADIGASFERLDTMRATPFDKRTVIAFAAAAALPMLPLVLTVMPLREIVKVLVNAMV